MHQIKDEIGEYRIGMTNAVMIGFDQLFPLVCYVCEQSHENILASTQYMGVFLGKGEARQRLLGVVSKEAGYSLELMDSAASFYCHASQFI